MLDRMSKHFANILRRFVNAAGILCIVFGGISASRTYASLYAIANTGSAPTGIRLGELPATIQTQLFTIVLGFLLLELAELAWRRFMRSNFSSKPTADAAA